MKEKAAKKGHSPKQTKAPKKTKAANGNAAPATPSGGLALGRPVLKQPSSKQQAAAQAGIVLRGDDSWAAPYFDPDDLRFLDRQLFG